MKKFDKFGDQVSFGDEPKFYLCSEADARIAGAERTIFDLAQALREIEKDGDDHSAAVATKALAAQSL